jgi:hypothetical protein
MGVERGARACAARWPVSLGGALLVLAVLGCAPAVATASEAAPRFGLSGFAALLVGPGGEPATLAGAHPDELAIGLGLNSVVRETPEGEVGVTSVEDLRDVVIDLPIGLAGSAVSAPTCTLARLSSPGEQGEPGASGCPQDTIVGHVETEPATGAAHIDGPLYNIVPERGVFAEFGFVDASGGSHVLYAGLVPSSAGYVMRIESRELPQVALTDFTAEIYGDPAARDGSSETPAPTFTNPAACDGEPLRTDVHIDSWQAPGARNPDGTPDFSDPNWVSGTYEAPPVTGCEQLRFQPTLAVRAEASQADSPTGLEVDLEAPESEGVGSLGTPPLRDAAVMLPEGLTIDPSTANGLQACPLAQAGISASGVPSAAAPQCPDASKLGTVELETPALASEVCTAAGKALEECPLPSERAKAPLTGSIYLATPFENPFSSPEHAGGSPLAIYVIVDDARTGVLLKIPAEVSADPATGRLTIAIDDGPQFPFGELKLRFFGGAGALLATPEACGDYTVSTALTPWSAPQSGPPATPSSSFELTQEAGGGACASAPPFAPSFAAGTLENQAGGYGPFSVSVARKDSEATLGSIGVTLPPGLLANVASVSPCPEPQAASGDCGAQSLLGEATVGLGAGAAPYWLHGGKVYLTASYHGDPFGLSIVLPTQAGPLVLTGNGGPGREVVRAAIAVDPTTAQLTVLIDPLPAILDGVPLRVRTVNLVLDRPRFMLNPTSCSPLAIDGSIASARGATANVSSRFQAADCRSLKFKPRLAALTSGNGQFAGHGASLHVELTTADGQANLRSLKLDLPQRLPARLETIQRACREATFARNPASCPKVSVIGSATVATPLFARPLRGPAILVSYGGRAFPDMVLVLQAEGVRIDLRGALFVDRHNVTSTTFRTIPDVPIRRLDLVLPEGNRSVLVASAGLCTKRPLRMSTAITGQNGALVKQTVKVAVAGCGRENNKRPRGGGGPRKKRDSTRS